MQISLIAFNARYIHSCPALFYVRNALHEKFPGCDIYLHQFTINDPYYDTLLRITSDKASAIFFSVYIWNANYINRLVNDLAKIAPDIPLVLGGPQVTYKNINSLPPQCTIIRGEIEGVDASFYDDLKENHLKREYIATPGKPFSFPYKDEDFSVLLKNRHVYYESSRGCPFGCTYCLSSATRGVHNRDVDEVKEELAKLLTHQPKIIRFVDRTFNANAQRALEIWRFLAEQQGDTVFHFEIAPGLFTEEMLAFLENIEAGRFQFEIGLQSTNLETLEAVNRTMDLASAQDIISCLAGYDNIHLHVDLILGLPHETQETFKRGFNDVFSLAPHYIQMGLLKVLPGTAISQSMEEFGMQCCAQPPYEILATRWMNHETLRYLHGVGECLEAFYNNRFFRSIFSYVRKIEQDPFEFFENLLEVCQKRNFFDLAKTQELMSSILFQLAEERPDKNLLHELLRFDWLRCGHKFLPEHLHDDSPSKIRDYLWHHLPENYSPLFTYKTRNDFFKQSAFFKFSEETLKETGHGDGKKEAYVCFLQEQAVGVFKLCKSVLISI